MSIIEWPPKELPAVRDYKLPPLPAGFEPREVQLIARQRLAESYRAGKRRPVIAATTGSGKTILAAMLIRSLLEKSPKSRVFFAAPRLSLIEQTAETFEMFGLPYGVIQGKNPKFDITAPLQLITEQTFPKRWDSRCEMTKSVFRQLRFDMGFIDEGHLQHQDFLSISDEITSHRIVLTATPYAKGMGHHNDDLILTKTARENEADGTVVPLVIKAAQRQIDRGSLERSSSGEYTEASETLQANQVIGNICDILNNDPDVQGRRAMVIVRSISTCIELTDMINRETKWRAACVYSGGSGREEINKAILAAGKAGHYDIIVSVKQLVEGFDDPKVSLLFMVRSFAPSKKNSSIPNAMCDWIQAHGRAGRKCEGKTHALVYDLGSNYAQGFPHPYDCDPFLDGGLDGWGEEVNPTTKPKKKPDEEARLPMKECPMCSSFIAKGNQCNVCGHELKSYYDVVQGEPVEIIDGEIIQLNPDDINLKLEKKEAVRWTTKEEKQRLYNGLAGVFFERIKSGEQIIPSTFKVGNHVDVDTELLIRRNKPRTAADLRRLLGDTKAYRKLATELMHYMIGLNYKSITAREYKAKKHKDDGIYPRGQRNGGDFKIVKDEEVAALYTLEQDKWRKAKHARRNGMAKGKQRKPKMKISRVSLG